MKMKLMVLNVLVSACVLEMSHADQLDPKIVTLSFQDKQSQKQDVEVLISNPMISPKGVSELARGGSDRGGGEARLVRSQVLASKRAHLLKEVVGVFQDINPNNNSVTTVKRLMAWIATGKVQLADPKSDAILKDMIKRGFGNDLNKTKFVIASSCKDRHGDEKSAVAKMNAPQSDICVSAAKIVNEFGPYIQDSDLMGLMMHEFSHHYGYEDADHSFAAAVAIEYQSDSEERNQEGDPLNYLIK